MGLVSYNLLKTVTGITLCRSMAEVGQQKTLIAV